MKNPVSQVRPRIISYSELDAPLSIDPVLDGGLKLDILDTLNNKANSTPYLKLASEPSADAPAVEIGSNGEYCILLSTPNLVFVKSSGSWNAVEKVNTMFFFSDSIDGIRRYYAFDDSLENIIQVHSIDFGNPGGESVKYTPQTLTPPQKTQARINIDAASQAYIDNAITALKSSGAIGNSVAGSVMPWFGTEASIPQDWAKINTTQTWYSKVEYAQLYQALGGENTPFGLTATTFSTPYFPAGTSIVQSGDTFVRGTNGGATTHVLTKEELPAVNAAGVSNQAIVQPGDIGAIKKSKSTDGNVTIKYYDNNGLGSEPDCLNVFPFPNLGSSAPIDIMNPCAPAMWIIKLKNTGGSFTALVDEFGHLILTFDDGTTQDAGSVCASNPTFILSTTEASTSVLIPVSAGTWISDINVLVLSGTPTINIPVINSGDMSGQKFYPNNVPIEFENAGNLEVNISGGTVKIQVIKYNI